MESEKVAKEHGYTLEYIRSIQSSKFSSSETRALESIQNAVDEISKSHDLIEKNRFALPNIKHVGSLVNVAEKAVKVLIQKKKQEDDSDNDDDSDLQASSAISAGNPTSPLISPLSIDRDEIERMTNIQLKAERNLRSTFDALALWRRTINMQKLFYLFQPLALGVCWIRSKVKWSKLKRQLLLQNGDISVCVVLHLQNS